MRDVEEREDGCLKEAGRGAEQCAKQPLAPTISSHRIKITVCNFSIKRLFWTNQELPRCKLCLVDLMTANKKYWTIGNTSRVKPNNLFFIIFHLLPFFVPRESTILLRDIHISGVDLSDSVYGHVRLWRAHNLSIHEKVYSPLD
jgi:hypothetical protein